MARSLDGIALLTYFRRLKLSKEADEAHHLAEAARGNHLQSQLNHLKHFENATGVSHIMYNMARFSEEKQRNRAQSIQSIQI